MGCVLGHHIPIVLAVARPDLCGVEQTLERCWKLGIAYHLTNICLQYGDSTRPSMVIKCDRCLGSVRSYLRRVLAASAKSRGNANQASRAGRRESSGLRSRMLRSRSWEWIQDIDPWLTTTGEHRFHVCLQHALTTSTYHHLPQSTWFASQNLAQTLLVPIL